METHPTLKWFSVIGIIIIIAGFFFMWFEITFLGILFLIFGLLVTGLSLISLFMMWISDRFLAPQKR
ncbi:MAG: hypothetical protein ACW99Q_14720 [Candidatus Kariarchaeaceae archaeon]|jgi:hypothetical protein